MMKQISILRGKVGMGAKGKFKIIDVTKDVTKSGALVYKVESLDEIVRLGYKKSEELKKLNLPTYLEVAYRREMVLELFNLFVMILKHEVDNSVEERDYDASKILRLEGIIDSTEKELEKIYGIPRIINKSKFSKIYTISSDYNGEGDIPKHLYKKAILVVTDPGQTSLSVNQEISKEQLDEANKRVRGRKARVQLTPSYTLYITDVGKPGKDSEGKQLPTKQILEPITKAKLDELNKMYDQPMKAMLYVPEKVEEIQTVKQLGLEKLGQKQFKPEVYRREVMVRVKNPGTSTLQKGQIISVADVDYYTKKFNVEVEEVYDLTKVTKHGKPLEKVVVATSELMPMVPSVASVAPALVEEDEFKPSSEEEKDDFIAEGNEDEEEVDEDIDEEEYDYDEGGDYDEQEGDYEY